MSRSISNQSVSLGFTLSEKAIRTCDERKPRIAAIGRTAMARCRELRDHPHGIGASLAVANSHTLDRILSQIKSAAETIQACRSHLAGGIQLPTGPRTIAETH